MDKKKVRKQYLRFEYWQNVDAYCALLLFIGGPPIFCMFSLSKVSKLYFRIQFKSQNIQINA
jgi:hypothetical protein